MPLHVSSTKILCIKLVNYWDKYTEMQGQQNVKKNRYMFISYTYIVIYINKNSYVEGRMGLSFFVNLYFLKDRFLYLI